MNFSVFQNAQDHGRHHTIPPSQVNNRANIYAIKKIGCSHILATSACGSLREEIGRGDLVIPDQFIDFTRFRKITFFEEFEPNEMKHTPMKALPPPVLLSNGTQRVAMQCGGTFTIVINRRTCEIIGITHGE